MVDKNTRNANKDQPVGKLSKRSDFKKSTGPSKLSSNELLDELCDLTTTELTDFTESTDWNDANFDAWKIKPSKSKKENLKTKGNFTTSTGICTSNENTMPFTMTLDGKADVLDNSLRSQQQPKRRSDKGENTSSNSTSFSYDDFTKQLDAARKQADSQKRNGEKNTPSKRPTSTDASASKQRQHVVENVTTDQDAKLRQTSFVQRIMIFLTIPVIVAVALPLITSRGAEEILSSSTSLMAKFSPFSYLGELASTPGRTTDSNCTASSNFCASERVLPACDKVDDDDEYDEYEFYSLRDDDFCSYYDHVVQQSDATRLDLSSSNEIHVFNNHFVPKNNIKHIEQDYCDVHYDEVGVWFVVTGTGNVIEASTCNSVTGMPAKISVFHGTSCGQLKCVSTNDYSESSCVAGSTVLWESMWNVDYYILVRSDIQLMRDDIGITVREGEVQTNDVCKSATTLQLDENKIHSDSNLLATGETSIPEEYCDVYHDEMGVWFHVVGTGSAIEASTSLSATEFDTKISIFYGVCDELVCVTSNNNYPGAEEDEFSDRSTAIWESTEGVDYYILVRGEGADEIGNFGIMVREVEVQPNNSCEGATVLDLQNNEVYPSSNLFATSTLINDNCDVQKDEIGVWFQVTGTGNVIEASTCTSVTDIDTKISIFNGTSCGELVCESTSNKVDENCEYQSTVSWESLQSVNYYILVRGNDIEEVGDFGVTVREIV